MAPGTGRGGWCSACRSAAAEAARARKTTISSRRAAAVLSGGQGTAAQAARTQLEIGLVPGATVAEVNAVIAELGAGILAMASVRVTWDEQGVDMIQVNFDRARLAETLG